MNSSVALTTFLHNYFSLNVFQFVYKCLSQFVYNFEMSAVHAAAHHMVPSMLKWLSTNSAFRDWQKRLQVDYMNPTIRLEVVVYRA